MSDKWEQYLSVYDIELSYLLSQARPLHLLEIGVQNGGSLEIWEKFLPPGSTITGIDIDARCRRVALRGNARVLIGDASDSKVLDDLLGDKKFDIIIDDGSHRQSDIISTFRSLFPRLIDGGSFFIEDLHSSYWQSHGGGLRKGGTAIEFLKEMIDAQNLNHIQGDDHQISELNSEARYLNSHVAKLAFYDSIAVVTKYSVPRTTPFRRIVSGARMQITSPLVYLNVLVAVPGAFNAIGGIADELLHEAVAELSQARSELVQLQSLHKSSAATTETLQQVLSEYTARIAELESELTASSAVAEALRGQLSERDSQIAGFEQVLAAAMATDEGLRGQLSERDGRIAELEQILTATVAADEVSRGQLSERDGRIAELEQILAATVAADEVSRGQLSERDGRIAELEQILAATVAADEVWRGQLLERDGRITELEQMLAATAAAKEGLHGQLSERDGRIAELETALTAQSLQNEIQVRLLAVAEQERAETRLNEQQAQLTIENLDQSLAQIRSAWVFKFDAALVKSMRVSAFGLAKSKPLLLISSGPDQRPQAGTL